MRIAVIAVMLGFIAALNCCAEETVSSRINEVTLYANQALVEREGVVKVVQGINHILLDSTAVNIDPDSVQASVFGEGEILSVQAKDAFLKEAPQENIKILEEKIRKLREELTSLTQRSGVSDKKETFLNSVINFGNVQIPAEIKTTFPTTENLQKMLVFLDESYNAVNQERQAITPQIENTQKAISAAEQELATLAGDRRLSKKVIEILFNSAKEQTVKIDATYLAYGAYWEPLYKVEVPIDLAGADITMFAKIRQVTGEDWDGVKMSISNAIPLMGARTPSLPSWRLDVYRAQPQQRRMEMMKSQVSPAKMSYETEERFDRAAASIADSDLKEAKVAEAEMSELPLSFEYAMPQNIDIESKDKETILPLFSKKMKGDFFYYSVPKISPMTFLVCRTASDKELLSANLNVYFAGRFVGKTYLEEKSPGEDFEVNLGSDRNVKVKREKISDKIDETFFGKIDRLTAVRQITYKITAENSKDKPVDIKLIDSIPVSATDRIEVKDVKLSLEPAKKDYQDKKGVMLWEFSLKPKEKKEIVIEFTLTYPKDIEVRGL